jgi:pimeloyl-ACP methyl ester carboxylesterase
VVQKEDAVPSTGSIRRWAKRIGLGLVVLLGAALAAGTAFEGIARWRDSGRFPQEGRSVVLGVEFPGVMLNLNCTGAGSPTVILETGLGVPAAGWALVQPEVARFTRVCSYDRAGYGWSSAGPMPRTSGQIARELHALLAASEEKGPYVLAGHSLGGYTVRLYTSRYPADVAGLVLVDASHEDQDSLLPPSVEKYMAEERASLGRQRALAPLLIATGIARLMATDEGAGKLSKEQRDKIRYLQLQSRFVEAAVSEMEVFAKSADEVRAAGNLGDRPLVVLTAGKEEDGADLPSGVSLGEMRAYQKTWITDLQVRQVRLSTRGRQVIVPDSSHMIPMERPDAVVAAIREVCSAVARGTDR